MFASKIPINTVFMLYIVVLFYRYKNRPNMTFDDTGATPDQEFEMHPDTQGVLEYATKYVCILHQCVIYIAIGLIYVITSSVHSV